LIDLCHLDEAGFGLTLPSSYTWFLQGERLTVPYQAPQGRRVNVLGAVFTHGPQAGRLETQSWAMLPKSRAKQPRLSDAARAAAHGLSEEQVGAIDGERLVAFLWRIAGRPAEAAPEWVRERPLVVALDNYSVHRGAKVCEAEAELTAAGIQLEYLARYCPEQSEIEPVWNDVKQHRLPIRSFERLADLKTAVDTALAEKAEQLRRNRGNSTNVHPLPT
jgi:transposase